MSQIQAKEAHTSSEAMTRLPEIQKNLMETLLKHNLMEMGVPTAAHGLMYQNAEVIREMLCMLNGLCGQGVVPSPSVSRPADKKSTPTYIEAKPINLTRQQTPNFDSELIFPSSNTKGQFGCPNCGQDFLNRDALAMHMMESVHSEACASTNNSISCSKEDRNPRLLNCHHIKASSINHQANSARRYIRLPLPASSSSAQFDSLFQSFMKVRPPLLDAGVPRPGRKPRRLIPVTAEGDRCGSEQVEDASRTVLSLKRPHSCELKLDNRNQDQPDRASSTPGSVQTADCSSFLESINYGSNLHVIKKAEQKELEPNQSAKVGRMDSLIEKRPRSTASENIDTTMPGRSGGKGVGGASGGPSHQWQLSDSMPNEAAVAGPYPFICRHCGIGFSDQTLFNLHMGLHTSFNPWQCNMCSKEFSNVYEFTAHALHY